MKRLLLSLSMLTVSVSSSFGQCPLPEIAPWTDDLEALTPTTSFTTENCWNEASGSTYDWNVDGVGGTPSVTTGPNGANSGVNYFYVEASNGTTGALAILESPLIDVTALTTPVLQFYYHMYGSNIGQLEIQAWDGASWITMDYIIGQQQTAETDPWTLKEVYLTGISGVTQIRFVATKAGTYGDISLDDFSVVESTATCPPPSLLSASNVSATSLDLSWVENGSATLWNIEYGAPGFSLGAGTQVLGATNNPENITGLSANTSYDFYVQADCGGGDLSAWVGPFSVTTPCASFTAPYTQDFENGGAIPSCWSQGASNGEDWIFATTGGHVGDAGTFGATPSGGYFAYVDDSSPHSSLTTLETPFVDVSGLTIPSLSFYLISNNENVTNVDFSVDVWDGAAWVSGVYTSNTNTVNGDWEKITIDLSALTITGDIQARFIVSENNGTDFYDDVAIDDVTFEEMPACADPSALNLVIATDTEATLSWTDVAGAGLANIEVGLPGFAPGTGAEVVSILGTTNNPETITGLTPATTYEFYVMSDCGGASGTSNWAGPFSFSTGFTAPDGVVCGSGFSTFIFSDDMETNTGWTGNIGTSNAQWDFPTALPGGNSSGTGPSGPASGTTYAEFEASGTTTTIASMVTPMIDLSTANSEAELSFYMHAFGDDIGTLNVGVGNTPTGPFTNVFSWSGEYQTAATDPWEHIAVDITSFIGQQVYIEFSYGALASGFEGDLAIDLVQVESCITCEPPSNLNLISADASSAEVSWIENGTATSWDLEYAPAGFSVGSGTNVLSTTNPETLTGLNADIFYEVYVRSICGPGDTSSYVGPISFNTFNQGEFMVWDTDCPSTGFIDISGTGTDTGLTDDGVLGVTMPFSILYQGVYLTDELTIGNNGFIKLGTLTATSSTLGDMNTLPDGFYPYLDDLDDETGTVYYETIGVAPNRTFVVQWDNMNNWPGNASDPTITFQLQIEEATHEIYYVYDDVVFGGTDAADDYGDNADIGISGPNQDYFVSNDDPVFLTENTCAHFFYTDCPRPTNYATIYTTTEEAGISWSAGLAGETNWTVIYGEAGFDPLTGGTTINTTSSSAILTGLNDVTIYDVYIYADCDPGTLQSLGYMGQFTTLPNCSDPTGLSATAGTDSLFTSWSWTESSGVGTYPSTGFNVQYGMSGFDLWTGTVTNADNNFTDTTVNAALMAGGVYEVYVQALCGTDTSNYVGPFTVTMPLDNDTTCFAENLNVDGTVYIFNNSGASVQANESTITPPATGCETTNGWCNTSINFTTWFTFQAPASGNILISGMDENFNGQVAIYEATDCSDFNTFTLIGANDDNVVTGANGPEFIQCGLVPGNTYYLMHDSWSTTLTGQYSLRLEEIDVQAGSSSGLIDACSGETVNLFDNVSGYDNGGVWTEWIATVGLSDSLFNTVGIAYQTFNFTYTVTQGCAIDSVVQQVEIYGPSNAGDDGILDVCLNQPFDLVSGLSGTVDLGGTWYDPANNALASSALTAPNIPGQFNYDYITSNGVCPNDTSNVVVNVSSSCDWLNVEELYFSGVNVYPNPATQNIFISNLGAEEVFSYELTDAQGKVLASEVNAINGTKITEINVKNLEIGIYLIRIYNENADRTFRIVKQ